MELAEGRSLIGIVLYHRSQDIGITHLFAADHGTVGCAYQEDILLIVVICCKEIEERYIVGLLDVVKS